MLRATIRLLPGITMNKIHFPHEITPDNSYKGQIHYQAMHYKDVSILQVSSTEQGVSLKIANITDRIIEIDVLITE